MTSAPYSLPLRVRKVGKSYVVADLNDRKPTFSYNACIYRFRDRL
ncbi:hypothetical protein [Methylocystis sp. B8]|nr:hypothetical protein [Methylocystis sp. B8]